MNWKLKSPPQKIKKIPDQYPPIVRILLAHRALFNQAEIANFLIPDYEKDLHDPFLFSDMTKAVERIKQAVVENESVLIFGDYDADGVLSTTIMATFFDWLGFDNYQIYIPDRQVEAYGLSEKAINQFIKNKVKLMITVDCGIANVAEIKIANQNGLEVIVTDHHLPQKKLPPALAIINPKREDDHYPFSELAGAGVAFKLVQALFRANYWPDKLTPGREKWLLDLVAVATVSDMVSLTGENRALTYFGLIVLRQARRPGLAALMRKLKINPKVVNEGDIGFMIGPRLNAAGRLAHADEAFNLLMAKVDQAKALALALDNHNHGRKALVEKVLDYAEGLDSAAEILVIGREDFSIGILGLAASRLVEKFKRPVFIWGLNGSGEIKGSCRSDGSINLVDLMEAAGGQRWFSDFGGHKFAGGFSLAVGREKDLSKKLNQAYRKVKKQNTEADIYYDARLELAEINEGLWSWLEKLSPFGLGNPQPVFLLERVLVVAIKTFGNIGQHLELIITDQSGKKLSIIAFFFLAPAYLVEGVGLAVLVNIEKSYFRRSNLRLRLIDLRLV